MRKTPPNLEPLFENRAMLPLPYITTFLQKDKAEVRCFGYFTLVYAYIRQYPLTPTISPTRLRSPLNPFTRRQVNKVTHLTYVRGATHVSQILTAAEWCGMVRCRTYAEC